MKLTKTEKIWLIAVIISYVCYNLPFVPPYNNAKGTFIHALLTLIPLWVTVYAGLIKVCRSYKIKDSDMSKKPGSSANTEVTKIGENHNRSKEETDNA